MLVGLQGPLIELLALICLLGPLLELLVLGLERGLGCAGQSRLVVLLVHQSVLSSS